MKVGFRLEDIIPILLKSIGDHEKTITDTIMFAVKNARYGTGCLISYDDIYHTQVGVRLH